MYELKECIENEERYGEMISRLEKMADMYGREFDGYLFEDAVEGTDELLEGKGVARAEEIEVNKDIDERRR